MYWISSAVFLLLTTGIITLFGLRFEDLLALLSRQQKTTLKEDLATIMKGKRKGLQKERYELEQLLKATGREEKYELLKKACIILFAAGSVAALALGNVYLMPVLGAGFALAPVWYLRSTTATYKRHLNEQLESALSIITTSYLRTENINKSIG